MFKEFRAFIARGNVLDLAVGVIIGGAFATITKSLTDDVLLPVIGWLFGGTDFSRFFIRLGPIPAGYQGSLADYAALKAAGVPLIGYGAFVTAIVNFLILAFIIFLIVRAANRMIATVEPEAPAEAAPPAEAPEVTLLREIRDTLKATGS
ncbi:MAG: mechanosensitive ion channel protein MscL [Proteobacteria bacterium SG_bin5]|nr:large conductance mechanosensitive channel protein MscL [Sphingomonas sp.]OQW44930.1 MAG: mechanosensitive ion channel protein MscL [Proteobacteria bacterium SG_bin5]